MKRYLNVPMTAAIAAVASVLAAVALAANSAAIDTRVDATLNRFYAQNDANRDLVQKAAAVLVFPRVTKGGVGLAGEFGEGALQVHGRTVGYYKVTGGSIGATLGVAHHSEVILFMTDAAREHLMNSSDWSLGADAGVAVVKKGAEAQYDTETLHKPVLAFVFGERGLLGDVSLEGAKVSKLPQRQAQAQ
jgi:lipid-binding SYLF domain-containing protein